MSKQLDVISFFSKVPSEILPLLTDLYECSQSKPDFKIEFGSGKKQGSFRIKLTTRVAQKKSVLGAYAKGEIWPGERSG